jgi:hypothetical protein
MRKGVVVVMYSRVAVLAYRYDNLRVVTHMVGDTILNLPTPPTPVV